MGKCGAHSPKGVGRRAEGGMWTVLPSSLAIVAKAVTCLFVTTMFFRSSFALAAASPSVVVRTCANGFAMLQGRTSR